MIDLIMPNASGVYAIQFLPSRKVYVGMTSVSFRSRLGQHKKSLRSGRHISDGLQLSYDKYGSAGMEFMVLEAWHDGIKDPEVIDLILKCEVKWWNYFSSMGWVMLNSLPSGRGSVVHTPETKEKIRKASVRSNEAKGVVTNLSHEDRQKLQEQTSLCLTKEELKERTGFNPKQLQRRGIVVPKMLRPDELRALRLRNLPIRELEELYFDLGMSTTEIGNRFGISQQSAHRIMISRGIAMRPVRPRDSDIEKMRTPRPIRKCLGCGSMFSQKKPSGVQKYCNRNCMDNRNRGDDQPSA